MSHRIPQSFIDDLLDRVDIVELIGRRVRLQKVGNNHQGLCPFHSEKTPSFSVNPAKQFYYCFGCQASGSALGFLMAYDKLSFVEAVEELAYQAGLELPQGSVQTNTPANTELYSVLEQCAQLYQTALKQNPPAHQYLKARGLDDKTIAHFRLGYAPAAWDTTLKHFGSPSEPELTRSGMLTSKSPQHHYDRFRDRIMFPIRDRRGRIVAFGGRLLGEGQPKYLNSPETAIFQKSHMLYGMYEIAQAKQPFSSVLLVEGYMDVIGLAQHGIANAVASLGTATNEGHFAQLFKIAAKVVICFDGDTAGQTAAKRAAEAALPSISDGRELKVLLLPPGEDPDSLIKQEGNAAFVKRIDTAQPVEEFLLNVMSQDLALDTLAGKAKLGELMRPLLQRLPPGIYRSLWGRRLAAVIGLSVEHPPQHTPTNRAIRQGITMNPMRIAIALSLQHPQYAHTLNYPELPSALPGAELLIQIVERVRARPEVTTGTLLEGFRDHPKHSALSKLCSWTPPGNPGETKIRAELEEALRRLKQQADKQRAHDLLELSASRPLIDAEKTELKSLLAAPYPTTEQPQISTDS